MEMKKISSGKLRAMGYDPRGKLLLVELDDGTMLEYNGVGEEIWRRLSSSGSAWSVYRDSIEEEYSSRRISRNPPSGKNPLDELFR
ncbi:MAG TPA: KTSC domain-containing protein [Burkholderiales bacterium]|nr:KTSC domain-containing protein [Burkholderiales bacterium]